MSFYQTAGTVNENGDQSIILHLRKDSGKEGWIVLGVLKGWKSVVDGRKVKRKVTPFKTLTWNISEVMWSGCFGIKQSKKGGYSRASVQKPSLEKMNAHLRVQWVKAHRGAALQTCGHKVTFKSTESSLTIFWSVGESRPTKEMLQAWMFEVLYIVL